MNLIIIQSRNGSKRLPFKSSLSISGYPTILHLINRLKTITNHDLKIVVATSSNEEDQIIYNLCRVNNIDCYRGDPLNVFKRYKNIINEYNPEYVVRITGDCPLIYPPIILKLLEIIQNNQSIDYASNTISRTFPKGFDAEVFKSSLIIERKNLTNLDIEHVTPFIYSENKFNIFSYEDVNNFSKYRITLDTRLDYFLIDNLINNWILKSKNNSPFDILSSNSIKDLIETNHNLKKLHEEANKF